MDLLTVGRAACGAVAFCGPPPWLHCAGAPCWWGVLRRLLARLAGWGGAPGDEPAADAPQPADV